jgi:hypothetical protein
MSGRQHPPSPPWSYAARGTWVEHELESAVLRGNPLGDPHVRPLWVYLPPGHDADPDRRYPTVYVIQGMTGQLDMWRNRSAFRKSFPELIDDLFAEGGAPPAIVVLADCWTSYGGSQFIDSAATGRYHTYLCSEVVPFVDMQHPTLHGARHRGIMGKSSGGYGAMVTPMLRPDLFGALATHAGDALFEHCYQRDFPEAVRALRESYGGSFERFFEDFRSRPAFSRSSDHVLLNTYAMAACYSADPDGTVQIPFDLDTGSPRPDVWERWLRWDPVRMVPRHADALRSLGGIWIDAGRHDEYFLDLGAAAFRAALVAAGVPESVIHFELFDAGHGAIEYRYPHSLRYLAERLQPGAG